MSKNVLSLAEAYYQAMSEKNIAEVEKYVHPDVTFTAPLAKTEGREAFLEGAKSFMTQFKTVTIHAKLGSEDQTQAMIVYAIDFPEPIGKIRTAGLLTFKEGLIVKIELFYDARVFVQK